MLLEAGIICKFTHVETKSRCRIRRLLHREDDVEMLNFRTYMNSLFAVSVIIAAVYLDPVSQVTLNIGIAVELHLILTILIECKTIVIELI